MAVRITRAGVGLTVGIIVLALVVLGGLYLAKERGEQARRADAIEVAQRNLDAQSGTGTLTPSIDGDVEKSGTPSEETKDKADKSTEGSNGSTEGTGGANEGVGSTTDGASGSTNGSSETTTQQSPNELPQTGASETAAIIAIALLTFASISYWQSRKALFEAR